MDGSGSTVNMKHLMGFIVIAMIVFNGVGLCCDETATASMKEEAETIVPNYQIRITSPSGGYEIEASSFEYLKEAIGFLLEGNKDIVKVNLSGQQGEIFMINHGLYELVVNSLKFLATVEESQKKAQQHFQLIINDALGRSKDEGENCLRTLREEFLTHLNTQKEISRKLQSLEHKFSEELESTEKWKIATSTGLSVASVVVPLITSNVVSRAASIVRSITGPILASTRTLLDSFWKHKEMALEGQKKLITSMDLNNDVVMHEYLGLINQVEQKLPSLLQNVDLVMGVTKEDEVREKVEKLIEDTIGDLLKQGEECCSNIANARKAIMKGILKIN